MQQTLSYSPWVQVVCYHPYWKNASGVYLVCTAQLQKSSQPHPKAWTTSTPGNLWQDYHDVSLWYWRKGNLLKTGNALRTEDYQCFYPRKFRNHHGTWDHRSEGGCLHWRCMQGESTRGGHPPLIGRSGGLPQELLNVRCHLVASGEFCRPNSCTLFKVTTIVMFICK